jgi:hypothetical protein
MADEAGSFEVNGKRYSLPTNLTMGEMCDAELYFGVAFGDGMAMGSMRMAAALMYTAIHREDPSVTVADVRELPIEVFESFITAESDAGPPPEENSDESEPSGLSSANGSVHRDDSLVNTGRPGSDIGSVSDLVTSPS